MKKILDKPYENDEFFRKWLVGLSPRTKENYSLEFHDWFIFVDMTPTEQVKKRMHDLTTEDLTQRLFSRTSSESLRNIWRSAETSNRRALRPCLEQLRASFRETVCR